MEASQSLCRAELNAAALEHFVYTPVDQDMITYLADAAHNVIQPVQCEEGSLPTLEEFIAQLVLSSNVQVPTLMSTLVYLNRLKSRLQPMAKGLRCTTHRIFLASLILAAKYLNDSSPKNKHWANYSVITHDTFAFGFSRTEVNLMEKQLLFLLDWDLRITKEDLYRELDSFLEPIRRDIKVRHERQIRRQLERALRKSEEEAWIAASHTPSREYPTPPSSRGNSRERQCLRETSPPALVYSAHDSSPSVSASSGSHHASAVSTPLNDPKADPNPYIYGSAYDSLVDALPMCPPEQCYLQYRKVPSNGAVGKGSQQLLPYEISPEELREMDSGRTVKRMRGMLGRVFGNSGPTAAAR
ncbi:hypothetical protein P8C59_008941 [Phyllachora maydis]|uniref:Cyclin N-terminal domain-containing protein n=1 Tax=Phyllachora maydis TaxID=1825666 RepID=A0AAD9IC39_9PEZI|nr:hypothetical protein P8C59_008941 [Phyllachora maydis]